MLLYRPAILWIFTNIIKSVIFQSTDRKRDPAMRKFKMNKIKAKKAQDHDCSNYFRRTLMKATRLQPP
jgi:hypothetical protein